LTLDLGSESQNGWVMNKRHSRAFKAKSAAGSLALAAGSLIAASAFATSMNPASLPPGSTSVTVPVWGSGASNYTTTPTGTGLAYCINGTCASGSLTRSDLAPLLTSGGAFLEVAGTTNLNPFGSNDVTFAFAFGGGAAQGVLSVNMPDFSTYLTDVQACDPSAGALLPCPSTDSGATAARDTSGNITFSATASTGLPINTVTVGGFPIGVATDVYAIYTDAPISALIDPTVTITYASGATSSFAGLGLTPLTPPAVPEPSALALLAAGLASLWLGMSLRRRMRF
jgi:hypothetical protein